MVDMAYIASIQKKITTVWQPLFNFMMTQKVVYYFRHWYKSLIIYLTYVIFCDNQHFAIAWYLCMYQYNVTLVLHELQ